MSILSRIGATPGRLAAAAVSFSLFAGVAVAENGYVDVRVRDDNAGCGPVVIKWPADQEEREYDPNPGRFDPKLEMAETQPLPVIHHHPALNQGQLYLPPQDMLYRHYFPESEAPPRLRRWIRPQYEEYLREQNPSTDVPYAVGDIPAGQAVIPGAVIVPTGIATAPATFAAGPDGYYVVESPAAPAMTTTPITATDAASALGSYSSQVLPVAPAAQTIAPTAAQPRASTDEGTASFIRLEGEAEKIPYVEMPAALTSPTISSSSSSSVVVPTATPVAVLSSEGQAERREPGDMVPIVFPGDPILPVGACGTPVCK